MVLVALVLYNGSTSRTSSHSAGSREEVCRERYIILLAIICSRRGKRPGEISITSVRAIGRSTVAPYMAAIGHIKIM